MNLRAIRLRLTLLYTLLSAIAVVALALVGMKVGTERIEDGATREGERVVREVLLQDDPEVGNTWWVTVGGEDEPVTVEAIADVWTEPPLDSVARGAIAYDVENTRFSQDGNEFLAYGQKVSATEAVVTAVDLEYYAARTGSLRLRLWLAALGAIVGIAVVGWFVSGRALSPVRAANTRQRDFIADAAHQLRTPLAVIRASASQALSRPREADAYVDSLTEIDSAASTAGAAVSELLELARIDSGQFAPRLAPLRLDLLIEEVAAGVRVDGCSIETRSDLPITVDADYALLHHAIENVIRNAAARATHVGVTARLEPDGRRAVVEVADNGPGFPPDLLPEVFERFRRGDGRGSSGLGLAIARSLVEAHRGGTEALNGDDGGAIVRLWLPRRNP